jgi:hypothetical protein
VRKLVQDLSMKFGLEPFTDFGLRRQEEKGMWRRNEGRDEGSGEEGGRGGEKGREERGGGEWEPLTNI